MIPIPISKIKTKVNANFLLALCDPKLLNSVSYWKRKPNLALDLGCAWRCSAAALIFQFILQELAMGVQSVQTSIIFRKHRE